MEPPGLVQLEKEIAEEEQRSGMINESTHTSMLSWQFRPSPDSALHSRLVLIENTNKGGEKVDINQVQLFNRIG